MRSGQVAFGPFLRPDDGFFGGDDLVQEFVEGAPDAPRGVANSLEIVLTPDQQGVRVRLIGELDLASVPEVDRVIQRLTEEGHSRVLIDLSGVQFMDSTGLSSILRAQRSADSNGHRLTLRRGSPQVQRLFELTGVADRLSFED